MRPFAGFPGYSYFPNPTAAAPAPPASGADRPNTTYYDYAAAAHAAAQQQQAQQQQQQQQQQQAQTTGRPEQAVNNSPLHRHHSEHIYQQHAHNPNVPQRKHSIGPPPRNNHQQMLLRSELYEDLGVKAYVTGM